MPFLLSTQWCALKSDRRHRPRAKDRRQNRLPLTVMPLEDRQLLTTPTLISVSSSASNLTLGQVDVLKATVITNPYNSTNLPTGGTVTFDNGNTMLGSAPLVNGSASLPTILQAGTYSVTASYSGTASFSASTSTTSAGSIFNTVGTGTYGNTVIDSGVPATSAELANPFGVAVASNGTIYIADTFNNEIDRVNPITGVATVIAGNGTYGYANGRALSAEFADPRGLALDATVNALFVADRDNNVIRELNLSTGIVTTVAGTGTYGDGGTGIPATSADLASPTAVAVDRSGTVLYIADTFNNMVRKVNLTNGIITTVAGTGTAGFSGDNGPATAAELFDPSGLAVGSSGTLYISDSDNEVVRQVNPTTQVITTIAGTPTTLGYSGDNGPATSATLATPYGVALNSANTVLYIADRDNNAIRELNLTTGIITTVAGTGPFGSTGDGGPATAATLSSPRSIALDAAGNLIIADTLGNQIRLVAGGSAAASVTVVPFVSIAPGNTTVFVPNVPMCGGRTQAIELSLADTANASAASRKRNYAVTTTPNARGRVSNFGVRMVRYNPSTHLLYVFPATRLSAGKTYQLIIRGQPFGTLTVTFSKFAIISETI